MSPCLNHLSSSLAAPCRSVSGRLRQLSVSRGGGASLSGFPDVVVIRRQPLSVSGGREGLLTVSESGRPLQPADDQPPSVSASAGGLGKTPLLSGVLDLTPGALGSGLVHHLGVPCILGYLTQVYLPNICMCVSHLTLLAMPVM